MARFVSGMLDVISVGGCVLREILIEGIILYLQKFLAHKLLSKT